MQQLSSMLELFGCKCFGSSNYGLVFRKAAPEGIFLLPHGWAVVVGSGL